MRRRQLFCDNLVSDANDNNGIISVIINNKHQPQWIRLGPIVNNNSNNEQFRLYLVYDVSMFRKMIKEDEDKHINSSQTESWLVEIEPSFVLMQIDISYFKRQREIWYAD